MRRGFSSPCNKDPVRLYERQSLLVLGLGLPKPFYWLRLLGVKFRTLGCDLLEEPVVSSQGARGSMEKDRNLLMFWGELEG